MTVNEIMERGVLRLRLVELHCQVDGCGNYAASHTVEMSPAVHSGKPRYLRVCIRHYEEISERMKGHACTCQRFEDGSKCFPNRTCDGCKDDDE